MNKRHYAFLLIITNIFGLHAGSPRSRPSIKDAKLTGARVAHFQAPQHSHSIAHLTAARSQRRVTAADRERAMECRAGIAVVGAVLIFGWYTLFPSQWTVLQEILQEHNVTSLSEIFNTHQ